VSDVKPNQLIAMDMLSSRALSLPHAATRWCPSRLDAAGERIQSHGRQERRQRERHHRGLAMNVMRLASRAQMRMEQQILRALLQGDSVPPGQTGSNKEVLRGETT